MTGFVHRIVVVTGTPGSGKSTISEKLAKRLGRAKLVRVNDLVRKKGLFYSRASDGTMVVELGRLKKEITGIIRANRGRAIIIEGHVLCDIALKGAVAVVVREHLPKLVGRLAARKYSIGKIRDNVVSEATDYCGVNAALNYDHVFELLNDKNAVSTIIRMMEGKKIAGAEIDLLGELEGLLKKDRRLVI